MSEIGNVLLLVACLFSLTYLFLPIGLYRLVTIIVFFCVLQSIAILIYFHIVDDFSLKNVYDYSHTTKPLIYKIFGIWGNQEGSMLLWAFTLTTYLLFMDIFIDCGGKMKKASFITQGLICFCFLLPTLFAYSPFIKMQNIETDGLGFNPILQDIALAIHPPMLYLGFLGFSIPFSLSIAALITNIDGSVWAKAVRPWVLVSCSFLTLGIGLGSWWAYRELGWGGIWFWDPVENISLMPWLISVTLIHLLSVVGRFNILKRFSIFLAIITFMLSITGTFLVRSGILSSIHTFSSDDSGYGLYLLILLGVTTISVLVVCLVSFVKTNHSSLVCTQYLRFVKKKETINHVTKVFEDRRFFSRITMIFINNLLFITAFFVVFVGTLYPIVLEYLTGELISVGAPYYNTLFNPIVLAVLIFAMMGQYTAAYPKNSLLQMLFEHRLSFCSAAAVLPFIFHMEPMVILSVSISVALLVFILEEYCKRIGLFNNKIRLIGSFLLAKGLSKSYYAMILAHAGVAILVLGVACLAGWHEKRENYLKIGDNLTVNKFKVTLRDIELIKRSNLHAVRGTMDIINILNNKIVGKVTPEYRFYLVEGQKNVESSIYHNLFFDICVVIGELDKSKSKIAVKVYYKPGISAVWLGSLLITFGLLLAALP